MFYGRPKAQGGTVLDYIRRFFENAQLDLELASTLREERERFLREQQPDMEALENEEELGDDALFTHSLEFEIMPYSERLKILHETEQDIRRNRRDPKSLKRLVNRVLQLKHAVDEAELKYPDVPYHIAVWRGALFYAYSDRRTVGEVHKRRSSSKFTNLAEARRRRQIA